MNLYFHDSLITLVILPIMAAFILPALSRLTTNKEKNIVRFPNYFFILIMLTQVIISIGIYQQVNTTGEIKYFLGGWAAPLGINFIVDGLNSLILLMVTLIGFLLALYIFKAFPVEKCRVKYYQLLFLITAGIIGTILSNDLFNIYVFLEIMSLSAYSLIAFRGKKSSLIGGIRYMVLGTVGTAFYLLAVIIMYKLFGNLSILEISKKITELNLTFNQAPLLLIISMGFFVIGLGLKAGVFPLHLWKPEAYAGASLPVAAYLSSAAGITGVYLFIRIIYTLFSPWVGVLKLFLLMLGILSIIYGGFLALKANNVKRLLAFSAICQIGYIMLGLGMGTALGYQGALYHLINLVLMEFLVFAAAGACIYRLGTDDLAQMGGLAREMPLSAILFGIGAMAVVGVPPLNGFISKLTLYRAGLELGQPVLTVIAMAFSIVTLAIYFKAFYGMFLGSSNIKEKDKNSVRTPFSLRLAVTSSVVICIGIGLFPEIVYEGVQNGLKSLQVPLIFEPGWAGWNPRIGLIFLLIGLLIAWILYMSNHRLVFGRKTGDKEASYFTGESLSKDSWGVGYYPQELNLSSKHLYWAFDQVFTHFTLKKEGLISSSVVFMVLTFLGFILLNIVYRGGF